MTIYTTDPNAIRCIEAIHLKDERTYLWECSRDMEIEPGDLLLVQVTVREGYAIVRATSSPYFITEAQHQEQIHPYCKVFKNLGKDLAPEFEFVKHKPKQPAPVVVTPEIAFHSGNGWGTLKNKSVRKKLSTNTRWINIAVKGIEHVFCVNYIESKDFIELAMESKAWGSPEPVPEKHLPAAKFIKEYLSGKKFRSTLKRTCNAKMVKDTPLLTKQIVIKQNQ